MPAESLENSTIVDSHQVTREFKRLVADLGQYLKDQKAMGVASVALDDQTLKTVSSWGTRQWKQHRFSGQGPSDARIMIVDSRGTFYQDKAGRLLVKILNAMHLTPAQVFICNAADLHQIRTRVSQGTFEIIIALGRQATGLLLGKDLPIEETSGKFHPFGGVKVMPTRHPSELLVDPGLKRGVWEDMQKVMAEAGLAHGG